MKRWLRNTVLALFLLVLLQVVLIVGDGLIDEPVSKANVAVILGTKVNKDGSLSARLKARLDKGLQLYNDSLIRQIYVSGGLGKEGHYEGTVMANYLITQGVPSAAIAIDNEGINTRNTALNFTSDFPEETAAVVVSQYFHVSRCKLAFRQLGVTDVEGVHCSHFEWRDPYSSLRELVGYYKYLLVY